MPKQNNDDNMYSMRCVICGTPLIKADIVKGHKSFNVSQVGGYNNPDSMSYKGLKCPKGHEYILYDISGQIKNKDINIEKDILVQLNEDVYNLDLKEIILDPNTKTYAVSYSFFTRLRTDKWKIFSRPSPPAQVLDNIGFYICSKIKSKDLKNKNIIFALVRNKINLLGFKYNIIWYLIEDE